MPKMTEQANSGNANWRLIVAQGKQVTAICDDGTTEDIMTCVRPEIAEYFVRKINQWSKSSHDNALYNRLCRAGD